MTLLVGGLRAGYGLNQAIDTLVQQMPAPSSTEFVRVMKAVSLGVPIQRALKDMATRVGSDDMSLVVTAISVQYEMGGNLANVLESISQTVRERIRITREIQVLTAQQRLTGYILAGFPVFLAVALTMIKPDYFVPFFEPGPFQLLPMVALVMLASIERWCDGFLWNRSMFAPMSLLASKLGRSLRKSAWAEDISSLMVLFM